MSSERLGKAGLVALILSATVAISFFTGYMFNRLERSRHQSYKPDLEAYFGTGILMIGSTRMVPSSYEVGIGVTYKDGTSGTLDVQLYDLGGDWRPDFGVIFGEDGSKMGIVLEKTSPLYPNLKQNIEEFLDEKKEEENNFLKV